MKQQRQYPRLLPISHSKPEPISIVTVRFSDDYKHNICRSQVIQNTANQFITINNELNLYFENLGSAINAGLDEAQHDLVVVVHEDVILPEHWETHLFRCLDELESAGIHWGLLGSVGWLEPDNETDELQPIGHWSDPHVYKNTLGQAAFTEVSRLDEQILIFRRSNGVRFDPKLPSIHNIGRDLPKTLAAIGLKTFAINAPTIHKYADSEGTLVVTTQDSPKIRDRESLAYRADKSLSDDYFTQKWIRPLPIPDATSNTLTAVQSLLESPVILIAKGGGGSRLLTDIAKDLGLFVGNDVNISGDALEMVHPIYRGLLRKLQRSSWKDAKAITTHEIRGYAAAMIEKACYPKFWGFKIPESIFLLPELLLSFPRARFIHLTRDPLSTCLRRTHMTARLDNQIGRATLPAAYQYLGYSKDAILSDPPIMHMAMTTRHQLEMAMDFFDTQQTTQTLHIRFEDVVEDPSQILSRTARWMEVEPISHKIVENADPGRTLAEKAECHQHTMHLIEQALQPIRQRLKYV